MNNHLASLLREQWIDLWSQHGYWGSRIPAVLGEELLSFWRKGERHYHTLEHLHECLLWLKARQAWAQRPFEVALALWFHDALYDPLAQDNEERCAQLALAQLPSTGLNKDSLERVVQMIRDTAHASSTETFSRDRALTHDIDLAILGTGMARYHIYSQQIREEYPNVSDADFQNGRAHVLKKLLGAPRLYHTDIFYHTHEKQARVNLRQELEKLKRSP